MKTKVDVLIIGGGLAGLTSAIHLAKFDFKVVLIEKNDYPKHKVCGEYISNEVLPYFKRLDLDISHLQPTRITNLQFTTSKGNAINQKLPLGGFGISRYTLDNYLCQKAIEMGCQIINDTVNQIEFKNNQFTVFTKDNLNFNSKIVLGAFGKRSNIDLSLNRNFTKKKSPWLAVKSYYSGNFSSDLVGLHNFEGGYCGVSKVENNRLNICYLVKYEIFKKYKNIQEFQQKVLFKNPQLKLIFENSKTFFEKPLTISQISFEKKPIIENHILMIGDAAGLIHPLCGNGMAMAIHSAKIISELLIDFSNNKINSRQELEKKYIKEWNSNFGNRLLMGRILSRILLNQKLAELLMKLIIIFPSILTGIIKKTHGKPIT